MKGFKNKMNKEIKDLWVSKLRSGEYQQTVRYLHDESSYCCLGVLCDLHSLDTNTPWEKTTDHTRNISVYMNSALYLPKEVREWAGLDSLMQNPSVFYEGGVTFLGNLNDQQKLTFNQIADLIEGQM